MRQNRHTRHDDDVAYRFVPGDVVRVTSSDATTTSATVLHTSEDGKVAWATQSGRDDDLGWRLLLDGSGTREGAEFLVGQRVLDRVRWSRG